LNNTPQQKRLHLGCGLNTPKDWINLDGSWNAWIAKHSFLRYLLKISHIVPPAQLDIPWSPTILVHDVRKGLPFEDNSLDAIYASHFLEHLYFVEAQRLLKECYRVLRPGGVMRMVVPDLRAIIQEYIEQQTARRVNDTQSSPADRFNQRLLLRSAEPPSGNILYRVYTSLKDFHSHKWMYDADSLVRQFQLAGFSNAREELYQQSRIEGIAEIETADRVLNGAGVCVEGTKPDNVR